jgi:hypothetical protein
MNRIKLLAARPAQYTSVAMLMALAGCSTNKPPPRPVAMVPAAPVSVIAPAAHNRIVPDDVAARAEVVWALRGGLNVAALLCGNKALRDDYNRILKTHRNPLIYNPKNP